MATKKATVRARRSPEEAKALIVSAAAEVLAARGPDAVGLKDVARAAGVSHALVSHYFGTYEALVEAVMSWHQARIRSALFARMAASPEAGPEQWIEYVFEAIGDPLYGRLAAWAVLSGRVNAEGFFTRRERGLSMVVDVLMARFGPSAPDARERIERLVLLALSASIGYVLGRNALWGALGHAATQARDDAYRAELATLLAPAVEALRRPPLATSRSERPKRSAR